MRLAEQQETLPAAEPSWFARQEPGQLFLYGLLAAVVVLVVVGWRLSWHTRFVAWLGQARTFLSEVRTEIKKVTFPGRNEVISTTIVVLITTFVFAIFLWLADLTITAVYSWTVERLGS